IANFNQNFGALSVKLTPEEMVELESYASMDNVQGERYPSTFLTTWQNSETPPLSSWEVLRMQLARLANYLKKS
ncbi:hypothetical protein EJB05_37128, partial [Eragrostis curvula]